MWRKKSEIQNLLFVGMHLIESQTSVWNEGFSTQHFIVQALANKNKVWTMSPYYPEDLPSFLSATDTNTVFEIYLLTIQIKNTLFVIYLLNWQYRYKYWFEIYLLQVPN